MMLAAVSGGFFYFYSRKPNVQYTTEDAKRGTLAQTVSATGKIVSEDQFDLAFKNSGRIKEVFVDIGSEVKKGQKIVELDIGTLWSELTQSKEELEYQDEILDNMKKRKDDYNHDQKEAQKSKIKIAEAGVSIVWRKINETNLYSPIDGTVIKRDFNPGETVGANAAVITVADIKKLVIEANIPESDIVKIKVGQRAAVDFDSLGPDEKFDADVAEINPAPTVIQDVVYYRVKLNIPDMDERLKPGMSANIDIRAAEKKETLMVLLRAVKNEGEKKYVEVLIDEKNNLTEKKYVETGLEGDGGMIEILSGIKEGERVVTFTKTQP